MRQAFPIPSVALVDGIPRVSSLDIAGLFGSFLLTSCDALRM